MHQRAAAATGTAAAPTRLRIRSRRSRWICPVDGVEQPRQWLGHTDTQLRASRHCFCMLPQLPCHRVVSLRCLPSDRHRRYRSSEHNISLLCSCTVQCVYTGAPHSSTPARTRGNARTDARARALRRAQMRRKIKAPRVVLLDCSLEYKKGESQVPGPWDRMGEGVHPRGHMRTGRGERGCIHHTLQAPWDRGAGTGGGGRIGGLGGAAGHASGEMRAASAWGASFREGGVRQHVDGRVQALQGCVCGGGGRGGGSGCRGMRGVFRPA